MPNDGPHDYGVSANAGHVHNVIQTPQGPTCTTCRAIVIDPITSFDDPRLQPPSVLDHLLAVLLVVKAHPDTTAEPIDYQLITISDAMGWDWPDYIQKVAEKYKGSPPHVEMNLKAKGVL